MLYNATILADKGITVSCRVYDGNVQQWFTGTIWSATEGSAHLYPLVEDALADPYFNRYSEQLTLPDGDYTLEYINTATGEVLGEENYYLNALAQHAVVESDLYDLVAGKVQDDAAKLSVATIGVQISEAIRRYSRVRPHQLCVDTTGDGTQDYDLPAGWVAGFSSIVGIEYPVGNVPASMLDSDAYALYQTTTGKNIRLLEDAPSATESFRTTFTAPHASSATIPENDVDAVASLGAGLCLEVLANAWLQTGDSTIAADSVNYRSKSAEGASRAKQMMKLYKEHLGLREDDSVPAASAISSKEINYPGGLDRLTHRRDDRRKR